MSSAFLFKSYFCFCCRKKNSRICTSGFSRTSWLMAKMSGSTYAFWFVIKISFQEGVFHEILKYKDNLRLILWTYRCSLKNWRGFLTAWLSDQLCFLYSFVLTTIKNYFAITQMQRTETARIKCLTLRKWTFCFPLAAFWLISSGGSERERQTMFSKSYVSADDRWQIVDSDTENS